MLNLANSTTDKLQLVTDAAQDVDVVASYADLNGTTITLGSQKTAITTATTTDIVATPAASTVRNVKTLHIRNKDTGAVTVTVVLDSGGTDYELHEVSLGAGEALQYVEGVGFEVLSEAVGYSVYTPTWTSTGTAPAIGDAVVIARYQQTVKTVHAWGSIVFGASSTFGTGNYRFAPPVLPNPNVNTTFSAGGFSLRDNNTGNFVIGSGLWAASGTLLQIQHGATYLGAETAVGQTAPWTWAQSDSIHWNIVYEAA